MNFEQVFYSVEAAVKKAPDAGDGWHALLALARRKVRRDCIRALEAVDLERDVAEVRRELNRIVRRTPIPPAVDTLYFGLFDQWVEGSDVEEIGFYVAGVKQFDPADPDSLVDPSYFPDDRFLEARVLRAIKAAANADETRRDFYEYGLALGAACLLARFSVRGRLARFRFVVGFDEGDYIVFPTSGA
jgi:hypothetical protein